MKTLRDFRCTVCENVSERFLDTELRTVECPECNGEAVQMMGMPTVRLEGVTGSFPGAHHKWAQIREDNARIKAKRQ